MAYSGMKVIHSGLAARIRYILNPDKTEGCSLCAGINTIPEMTYEVQRGASLSANAKEGLITNRNQRIIIRVTDGELNAIRKNAERAGLNVSRYARQRMIIQPVTAALLPDVHRLRADISGLCNNVNQIARAVNARAREPTRAAEEAAVYARRAYDLVSEIREQIGHGV